jgi:hypothetical protein
MSSKSKYQRLFFLKHLRCIPLALLLSAISLLLDSSTSFATQTHGQPEGLYAHQMAHAFFIISMWIFDFWLRQRKLVNEPGWRQIQIAAVLFILWNVDAMAVHFLDEQVHILNTRIVDLWQFQIEYAEGYRSLGILYYLLKLDHLLCVPAMVYLYLGLKRIALEAEAAPSGSEPR